jgi:hypothetical protein
VKGAGIIQTATVVFLAVSACVAGDTAAAGPASGSAKTVAAADTAAAGVSAVDSTIGSLTIRSVPAGAAVVIDGMPVGETPVRIDSLPAGRHRLQLLMEKYLTKAANIVVNGGSDGEVSFTMLKPTALTVVGTPEGAAVRIDTLAAAALPCRREGLKPGAYRVSVSHPGHAALDTTVTLADGADDTLRVALAPPAAAAAADKEKPQPRAPRGSGRRIATIAAVAAFTVFSVILLAVDLASD